MIVIDVWTYYVWCWAGRKQTNSAAFKLWIVPDKHRYSNKIHREDSKYGKTWSNTRRGGRLKAGKNLLICPDLEPPPWSPPQKKKFQPTPIKYVYFKREDTHKNSFFSGWTTKKKNIFLHLWVFKITRTHREKASIV